MTTDYITISRNMSICYIFSCRGNASDFWLLMASEALEWRREGKDGRGEGWVSLEFGMLHAESNIGNQGVFSPGVYG